MQRWNHAHVWWDWAAPIQSLTWCDTSLISLTCLFWKQTWSNGCLYVWETWAWTFSQPNFKIFQCPDQSDQHNFKTWHEIRQKSWSIWSPLFQSQRWKDAYTWLDWAGHFYTQTWTHVWYDWVVQLQSKTWSHDHPWEAWAIQHGTLTWPHEVLIILISSFYHSDRLTHSSDQFEQLSYKLRHWPNHKPDQHEMVIRRVKHEAKHIPEHADEFDFEPEHKFWCTTHPLINL